MLNKMCAFWCYSSGVLLTYVKWEILQRIRDFNTYHALLLCDLLVFIVMSSCGYHSIVGWFLHSSTGQLVHAGGIAPQWELTAAKLTPPLALWQ